MTPEAPVIPNMYEEEPFHVYAILSEEGLKAGNMSVTYFNTHEEKEETLVVRIDPASIVSSDDLAAFQLAAKRKIESFSRLTKEEQKAKDSEIVDLSTKYSVLCDKTAFFGKVKNKDKPTEDMETVEVPVKKLQQPHGHFGGFVSITYSQKSLLGARTFFILIIDISGDII